MMNNQTTKTTNKPILYTFRRCPYAMRARLAIQSSGLIIEYREILLKDKPIDMLNASAKGTVPVLVLNDKKVIDESIDIMFWALRQSDPMNLLDENKLNTSKELISVNDFDFKQKLDLYKYAARFPEKSEIEYRNECLFFLELLEDRLQKNQFLMGNKLSIADIAIFPFVRQFAFVDKKWFDASKYDKLKTWLNNNLNSELFKEIMVKRELWKN